MAEPWDRRVLGLPGEPHRRRSADRLRGGPDAPSGAGRHAARGLAGTLGALRASAARRACCVAEPSAHRSTHLPGARVLVLEPTSVRRSIYNDVVYLCPHPQPDVLRAPEAGCHHTTWRNQVTRPAGVKKPAPRNPWSRARSEFLCPTSPTPRRDRRGTEVGPQPWRSTCSAG
jgi:hypothetical protein